YGYIGSVILQIICFVFVLLKPFNMSDAFAAQLSFMMVGLWWMGFAQITFKRLPNGSAAAVESSVNLLTKGFEELKKVWHQATRLPLLKKYLLAFFF
ncbi:MFS transporter, partial [Enterobacter hormaechei]